MQFTKWITLAFGALCLVAVAGVLNVSHLYYMAALLLTLPGISYGLGWYALQGLEFTRELPPTAWENETGEITYVVKNPTRLARFFLNVQEPLPAWITLLEEEPPPFNVGALDTTRLVQRVHFQRRGVYGVQGFEVLAMDPLGVFSFSRHIRGDGEIVVYPAPPLVETLGLSGSERYGWQELTSQLLRGASVDPDGVRRYAPGDPLRRIHWRQTARTGKLTVLEFEESQSVHLVIALDLQKGTEVGAGRETTLEYGIRLAAGLAQEAIRQGASVQLVTASSEKNELRMDAPVAGRGQERLFLTLDALARAEAQAAPPISEVVANQVGVLPPGTTLIVITASQDKALPLSLLRYSSTGTNVIVVGVDAASFAASPASRHEDAEAATRFFADLMGAGAQPYVLRKHPQGLLLPEAVLDEANQVTNAY